MQAIMQEGLPRQQNIKNLHRCITHLHHRRHFGDTLRRLRYLRQEMSLPSNQDRQHTQKYG